jgi:aconitate hydratase
MAGTTRSSGSTRSRAARLPYSIKILLENLLRNEDGVTVTRDDIAYFASWDPKAEPSKEIQYRPARVLMQDFTGVPAVVDLAAMRDAMRASAATRSGSIRCSPRSWSSTTRCRWTTSAPTTPSPRTPRWSSERNRERYQFLKWGQQAFDGFKVVPPDTGIVHQVNVEYLARVVFPKRTTGCPGLFRTPAWAPTPTPP